MTFRGEQMRPLLGQAVAEAVNTRHAAQGGGGPERSRALHPLYSHWRAMIVRCTNQKSPSFQYYGGRGITVCERWLHDFFAFAADVGPRPTSSHSIDRINNDGNYEPGNVRWATPSEQNRNQRRTIRITVDGETMALADWADRVGLPQEVLRARHGAGWTDEDIVRTPWMRDERQPAKDVLTERQCDVLVYVIRSTAERGFPPTLREIGRRFAIRSTNGVNDHLRALERKGAIERTDGVTRSIKPTEKGRQMAGLGRPDVCPTCGKCRS